MLIECVPNVSEGRDEQKIEAFAAAIRSVRGAALLHVDAGYDANRTVFTFVGSPEAVRDAAEALFQKAAELIDMRQQSGAHPRLGAVDVVPFVPLHGEDMAVCIECARTLGQRVADSFGLPVFLYEDAANHKGRSDLAAIRRGEYEGLSSKLQNPEWFPDFGPRECHPRLGAAVIGARKFLIAYNVNLTTDDARVAQRIASRIRTSGEASASRLHACKAIGWQMPSFGCAQVSMNLTDFEQTGLYEAYAACRTEAQQLGVDVDGSELIGLVPKQALLNVAQAIGISSDEDAMLREAVKRLGLERFKPFKPVERVIELAAAAHGL